MLTDSQIKSFKPKDKTYIKADFKGLILRIFPSGKKVFYYRYKIDNQQKLLTIGEYPYISLTEARIKHAELYKNVKVEQRNPVQEKKQSKQQRKKDPTITEIADEFYQRYLCKNLKKPDEAFRLIKQNVIPIIGDIKINELKRHDIIYCLTKIVDRDCNVLANRTLSQIKSLLRYVVEQGLLEASPAELIRKQSIGGTEKPRERFLSKDEVQIFLDKIDQAPFNRITQLVLKTLLFSGKRISEIVNAEWSEINFQNNTWIIPDKKAKYAQGDTVYLTASLKKFFLELQQISQSETWVCAFHTDRPIKYQSVDRAVKRHLEFFGFTEAWTPHDLRRTVNTLMNEHNLAQPHIIEALLSHKIQGIEKVYNRAVYREEKKKALIAWDNFLNSF